MANPKKRMFIVDDDVHHNDMLNRFLQDKFNVDVMAFTNGEDALRNLQWQPTYAVVDYHLDRTDPERMSGLDVLKQIRQVSPTTHVLMLCDHDQIEVASESLKLGAYDYVVKNPTAFLRVENGMRRLDETLRLRASLRSWRTYALVVSFLVALAIGGIVLFMVQGG